MYTRSITNMSTHLCDNVTISTKALQNWKCTCRCIHKFILSASDVCTSILFYSHQFVHRHQPFFILTNMCSESRSRSAAVPERRRDSQGRFTESHDRSELAVRRSELQIERENRYRRCNRMNSNEVFEQLLDVAFLPSASKKQWMPSSSKDGPLRVIVKRLFKSKFILSTGRRSSLAPGISMAR